jgi:type I site-specific restriction endonuclease
VSTFDCRTAISCSEDGSVCVWRVWRAGSEPPAMTWVEQVLIRRAELRGLQHLCGDLSERLRHQQHEQLVALAHHQVAAARDAALSSSAMDVQVSEVRRQIDAMQSAHLDQLQQKLQQLAEATEEHEALVARVEDQYQGKLIYEYSRVEQLKLQLTQQQQHYQQQVFSLSTFNMGSIFVHLGLL